MFSTLVLLKFKMHISYERIFINCHFKNKPGSDSDFDGPRATL